MDQIKKQLAVVLEYGFWIGCGVVLLGSLGIWWMSTSTLSSESEKQISTIRSADSTVTTLRNEMATQPNEKSHAEMEKMIKERENQILDAWIDIYNQQRKILTWPTELREDFIDEFRYAKDTETGEFLPDFDPKTGLRIPGQRKLRLPFESFAAFPLEESEKAAPLILQNYRRHIEQVLPDVAAIAQTEWVADFNSKSNAATMEGMDRGDMMGDNSRTPVDITGQTKQPVVIWSSSSQESVLSDLFPWRGRRPNTLEVYYSQENLWILKQLLSIVREVNSGAKMAFEAKIREIKAIRIGKSVRFGAGTVATPGSDVIAGGMDEMMGMGDDMMGMGDEMGMGTGLDMGLGGTIGTEVDPGDNRYVNAALEPVTGSALRTALGSNSPSDAPMAVAKRVPIMMSVQIDQRYLPLLLAKCGSAPLMVEVRQTRLLGKDTGSRMGMGMGGDDMDGMGGEMDGMDGMDAGGFGLSRQSGPVKPVEEFPLDKTVEIYGLIYMYNPPNAEGLGVKQITEENVDAAVKAQVAPAAPTNDALPAPGTATPPAAAPANPTAPGTDTTQPATPPVASTTP